MKTTRPIFTDVAVTIRTSRLLIQSIQVSDLKDYHEMRTDPQTMLQTIKGFVDSNQDATLEYMERFLSPNNLSTLGLSIFELTGRPSSTSIDATHDAQSPTSGTDPNNTARKDKRFVGKIGVRNLDVPEVGYMIRREDWRKGYATEALNGMLNHYWSLERKVVEVEDDWPELKPYQSLDPDGSVREGLRAMIAASNIGSRRVLEKCGFRLVEGKQFKPEPDHRGPKTRIWYYLERPLP